MAKGNDGHVLQHGVECFLAQRLATMADARRLLVLLTHGMAPFEPFDPRQTGPRSLIDAALRWAAEPRAEVEPPLITAYRAKRADRLHYPNSAELISALVGTEHVCGRIAETVDCKIEKLRSRWRGTHLEVVDRSWRGLAHRLYAADVPWLVSMDPYSYNISRPTAESPYLHPADWSRLGRFIEKLSSNGQPGAAAVFCYGLRPDKCRGNADRFEEDGLRFAQEQDLDMRTIRLQDRDSQGNRDVGLVFSTNSSLLGAAADSFDRLKLDLQLVDARRALTIPASRPAPLP